jgi:hypothetical protein
VRNIFATETENLNTEGQSHGQIPEERNGKSAGPTEEHLPRGPREGQGDRKHRPAVATALLLLFIGIHNAWDGVAYHLFTKKS